MIADKQLLVDGLRYLLKGILPFWMALFFKIFESIDFGTLEFSSVSLAIISFFKCLEIFVLTIGGIIVFLTVAWFFLDWAENKIKQLENGTLDFGDPVLYIFMVLAISTIVYIILQVLVIILHKFLVSLFKILLIPVSLFLFLLAFFFHRVDQYEYTSPATAYNNWDVFTLRYSFDRQMKRNKPVFEKVCRYGSVEMVKYLIAEFQLDLHKFCNAKHAGYKTKLGYIASIPGRQAMVRFLAEALVKSGSISTNECVICMEELPGLCFVPCSHEVVCSDCWLELRVANFDWKCPYCRTEIVGTVDDVFERRVVQNAGDGF